MISDALTFAVLVVVGLTFWELRGYMRDERLREAKKVRTTVEVPVLDLRPGDVLVISTEHHLSSEQIKTLRFQVEDLLNGEPKRAIVLDHGLTLQILRRTP